MAHADDRRTASLDDLPTTPGEGDSLPVDVEQFGDEYIVSALLPGLRTQDIDVAVDGRQVRIEASVPDTKRRFLPARRKTVSRVIRLPEPVNRQTVQASYQDDLLRVTLETWKD